MKHKISNALRGRSIKGTIIKSELKSESAVDTQREYGDTNPGNASVEIISCISFQKFRYIGENRPGTKHQEKDFMTLRLSNLQEKVVRVIIICTDADCRELIHPNGLVGKDCHDGIYDKEYAVTKQVFDIKIPYLRTERMKIKKRGQERIQGVLSDRASYLPSPYKERCLSQCTERYTSSRDKFDTTKVCFGVIVTVEKYHGKLNGTLHAVSHVVKNASEKTFLSIRKLSNKLVPALTGAFIDIFTTEDGPEIEPGKYSLSVSYDPENPVVEGWKSEVFSPNKEHLLYKRVITYKVPPFGLKPDLESPVTATLHLHCPQSNQFCKTEFQYVPLKGSVRDEKQVFRGQKRNYVDLDVKLAPPKRLRTEGCDGDRGPDVLKADIKTNINAHSGASSEVIYIDKQGAFEANEAMNFASPHNQQQVYPQEGSVFIHHKDPQTGESSFILDMDASGGSGKNASLINSGQYIFQIHEEDASSNAVQDVKAAKDSAQIFQSSPQNVEAVAAEYSESIPSNAVFVYTTDGTIPEEVNSNCMLLQRVTDDGQIVFAYPPVFGHGEKQISVLTGDSSLPSFIYSNVPTQSTQADTVMDQRSVSYTSKMASSSDQMPGSESDSCYPSLAVDNGPNSPKEPMSANNIVSTVPSSSAIVRHYEPVSASSSAVSLFQRKLDPNEATLSPSPWEVDRGDLPTEYGIIYKPYESPSEAANLVLAALKTGSLNPFSKTGEMYRPPSATASELRHHQQHVHNSDEQLQLLEIDANDVEKEVFVSPSEEQPASVKNDAVVSKPTGLNALSEGANISNSLHYRKLYEMASNFGNGIHVCEGNERGNRVN